MIEVITAPDHVAAFHIWGRLSADEYDDIIPKIEEKLKDHNNIGVLADLTGLENIDAGAVRRDIQYGLSKIGELHRFQRAVVITDKKWIESATKLTDVLFPQVDARVFSAQERKQAMDWAAAIN